MLKDLVVIVVKVVKVIIVRVIAVFILFKDAKPKRLYIKLLNCYI